MTLIKFHTTNVTYVSIIYAYIELGATLTSNCNYVIITKAPDEVVNGVVKSVYNCVYRGPRHSAVNVTFTATSASYSKSYVVLMTSGLYSGDMPLNITFNSACPLNIKCTKEDDLVMIKQRQVIANIGGFRIGKNAIWDNVTI